MQLSLLSLQPRGGDLLPTHPLWCIGNAPVDNHFQQNEGVLHDDDHDDLAEREEGGGGRPSTVSITWYLTTRLYTNWYVL